MPIDPVTAAALIKTGGTLLGSVLGGGGSGAGAAARTAKSVGEANLQNQKHSDHARPTWIVEGAKRAGIHPLAMLGMNPAQGVSVQNQPEQESNLGQNLGRAAASLYEGRADKILKDAQLQNINAHTDLLRSQATNVNRQVGDAPNPQTRDPQVQTLPDIQTSARKDDVGLSSAKWDPASKAWVIGIDATTGKKLTIEAPYAQTLGEAMEQAPAGISHALYAEYLTKRKKTKSADAVKKLYYDLKHKREKKIKDRIDYNKKTNAPWWKY